MDAVSVSVSRHAKRNGVLTLGMRGEASATMGSERARREAAREDITLEEVEEEKKGANDCRYRPWLSRERWCFQGHFEILFNRMPAHHPPRRRPEDRAGHLLPNGVNSAFPLAASSLDRRV